MPFEDKNFGVYIQTWPGDYHLCLALIASLRHWHPDLPITLIPGDHFDPADHPFSDVDILSAPEGFLGELGHADRCFWSWFGPYKKFLYLDADLICLRPIKVGIQRICDSEETEIFAHVFAEPGEWSAALDDEEHIRHQECLDWLRMGLGTERHLRAFDPEWNFLKRCPVPSGVWGGSRGQMPVELIQGLHERERRYYEEELKRPFGWDKGMVFYIDQGRFNYLMDHADLTCLNLAPDLHDQWGGEGIRFSLEDFWRGDAESAFIHWAGVPRPTLSWFSSGRGYRWFAKRWDDGVVAREWLHLDEIPAYGVWKHFYQVSGGNISQSLRLRHTLSTLKTMRKKIGRHRP